MTPITATPIALPTWRPVVSTPDAAPTCWLSTRNRTVEAVEARNPPLRLPLGQMAIDHIRAALDAESKELDAWAHLSVTADFPQSDTEAPA
jgi:hypothetical protein